MCGIAGFLNTRGAPVSSATVHLMNEAQRHRGPDGEGVHVSGPVGLGHRRLSIIDLEGGKQPLSNEDGSIWVTFNGEIYNFRELRAELVSKGHQFRTHSDTEVLVHGYEEWGTDLPQRLRGMFAFVIWDDRKQQLFLARDRLGIKPLYYWSSPNSFAFASELLGLSALPAFDRELNLSAIDLFLHYAYIPAPETIYRHVRKLPPGHILLVQANGRTAGPKRYWSLQFKPDRSLSEAAWVERIDAALKETIQAHLVSDVPFGAFLSGGIDSSTVVAYMSQMLSSPVQAFTIGHQVESYDETRWAREAAALTHAEHHIEITEPNSLDLLPTLVRHYGEPFADSSAIPTYHVSKLARQHVKMVLSGDGGDELFAGYHAYAAIIWEHRQPAGTYRRTKHLVANLARQAGLWPSRPGVLDDKYHRSAVIPPEQRQQLWQRQHRGLIDQSYRDYRARFEEVRQPDLLNHLQAVDIANYLPFDNLTKVDIASMYHGLEVRVPLLDHVFLETAAQVPPELKLVPAGHQPQIGRFELPFGGDIVGKYLLKKNAERFFSADFLHRPKRGFEVPIKHWLTGKFEPELRDRLLNSQGPWAELFERNALEEMLQRGHDDRVECWKLWSLLVLQEWFAQNQASTSSLSKSVDGRGACAP